LKQFGFRVQLGLVTAVRNVVQLERGPTGVAAVHSDPERSAESSESGSVEEHQQRRADLALQKKDSGMVQET
jgi:hypothetical protein